MAETELAAVVSVVGIGGCQSLSNLERLAAVVERGGSVSFLGQNDAHTVEAGGKMDPARRVLAVGGDHRFAKLSATAIFRQRSFEVPVPPKEVGVIVGAGRERSLKSSIARKLRGQGLVDG